MLAIFFLFGLFHSSYLAKLENIEEIKSQEPVVSDVHTFLEPPPEEAKFTDGESSFVVPKSSSLLTNGEIEDILGLKPPGTFINPETTNVVNPEAKNEEFNIPEPALTFQAPPRNVPRLYGAPVDREETEDDLRPDEDGEPLVVIPPIFVRKGSEPSNDESILSLTEVKNVDQSHALNEPEDEPKKDMPGMPFSFDWQVRDDESVNDFSHKSSSDGYVTSGSYHVRLPDGRLQTIYYTADKDGYRAKIKYS